MKKTLRILVVDDNQHMTRTVADILQLEGHFVQEAWSATQAFEYVRSERYDCVFTDVVMPGMKWVRTK